MVVPDGQKSSEAMRHSVRYGCMYENNTVMIPPSALLADKSSALMHGSRVLIAPNPLSAYQWMSIKRQGLLGNKLPTKQRRTGGCQVQCNTKPRASSNLSLDQSTSSSTRIVVLLQPQAHRPPVYSQTPWFCHRPCCVLNGRCRVIVESRHATSGGRHLG